jgi:FkbM family methyltransferase
MNERLLLREQFRQGVIDKHEYSRAMCRQHAVLVEYAELLKGTDIVRIEITADGIWLHSGLAPVAMACDPADRGTPAMVSLHFGQYERAEFDMWRRLLPRGAVIADIGANIGWYAAHMAAFDPTASVVAFEPVPGNFNWLSKTIARNNLRNVRLERLALSDRRGAITIYVDPTIGGAASSHPTIYAMSSSGITVDATTLDDYALSHHLKLDAVKLDVEGAELAVLKGSNLVLSQQRPMIFSEMLRRHARAFGYHPNNIIELMRSHGYGCFRTNGARLSSFDSMEEDTVDTNFFFLHRDAHAAILTALVT